MNLHDYYSPLLKDLEILISGVFHESYMEYILKSEFLFTLENNTEQLSDWKNKHEGKTPSQSLRDNVLEQVGRPVHDLLR